tara:strand:- start:258 stop:566 length:309 start_codon:yes stop_codon:yes gene_type:complete
LLSTLNPLINPLTILPNTLSIRSIKYGSIVEFHTFAVAFHLLRFNVITLPMLSQAVSMTEQICSLGIFFNTHKTMADDPPPTNNPELLPILLILNLTYVISF